MLHIITIVLDGLPQITWHLPVFNRLKIPWVWHVAEGVADNVLDTSWCKKMAPRLSNDGTTTYLNSIRHHPRVRIYQQQLWHGKVSMFRTVSNAIKEPGIILQVDSDELWEPWQIEKIVEQFERLPTLTCARFPCVYLIGQNIRTVGENCYGNNPGEFLRAFRFSPGMKWLKHEPPMLEGATGTTEVCMSRDTSRELGLTFWHYAWVFPQQVAMKELYYGYDHAFERWRNIQTNQHWPIKDLRRWIPWVGEGAQADLLFK